MRSQVVLDALQPQSLVQVATHRRHLSGALCIDGVDIVRSRGCERHLESGSIHRAPMLFFAVSGLDFVLEGAS